MRRSLSVILLSFPFLFAGKCKKADDTVDVPDLPATPEIRIQVISVEPDRVDPDQSFRAVVYGSAFEDGASVWVGADRVASVTVRDENTLGVSVPPQTPGVYDVRVVNPDGTSATLRSGLTVERTVDPTAGLNCSLVRVHFDFDAATLSGDAQHELTKNLACFEQGSATVRIEGHCDDRGTTDYNLALGQRRADAINRWLLNHGVSPSRLRAVSYGEERPIARGENESAWSENRRGDIKVER